MITSMYFNDIKDFINLELGVKRFQGNIERFHFNPIQFKSLFKNPQKKEIREKNITRSQK
ncbi:hypothetical protein KM1_032310 [Entamoeba histolytica HM-3:IMSS]|uniref:Uncharacterized protein n=2 Tax=Entamoeba histolytica TaxID=5759 RepID=M2S519_ENTHI|nr:Hypothetical protein EHI5A_028100 [Entamoeba histolytica KU27]EMS15632.1 hypothetical protein KM1_032310 [Entamoeba histolytica HM-3:IMSS]